MKTSLLKSITPLATAAAIALAGGYPALASDQGTGDEAEPAQTEMTDGEKRLARMLEGRVAGEPQNCIRQLLNERLTVIDKTAYVYGSGRTIYVQRTRNPEDIDRDDTLVSRRFNASELCKQDVVTTIDPVLGFFTGAVFFDDFIPYTRVEKDEG